MSHYSILILGDDPEGQLDPYAELTGGDEPLAEDYRAEFVVDVPAADFAGQARAIVAGRAAHDPAQAEAYRQLLQTGGPAAVFTRWYGGEVGPAGDWGHYVNPDAKWDWITLGGRWQGSLHLLPGRSGSCGERSWTNAKQPVLPGRCDQARFANIDWAATRTRFTPFAVLKDGEWYEQGELGWFGCVAAPKTDIAWEAEIDALLTGLPPETLVSVYDCHV